MENKKRRVVFYARVSTEHEAQLSALENQVQYYDNILKAHPDWELIDRYIDEGITGTSVKKRKNFMRMMEDAKNGLFDLIITREVSRFARNTVDTLQQTRLLKKYNVEVYFTEDNIWTMNDEDGELKLTLMATLAQNESKKTSLRVKAGQAVSFENGVLYGNGNVLGYDRVDKKFVINEEQAETVRIIFNLYAQGNGMRKIQFELERLERLTATGMKKWSCSSISRVLHNQFYCGIIEYRKEVVLDYLEQKKVTNYDYVDKVVVEGKNYPPIISKELYQKVQDILSTKTASKNNSGKRGVKPPSDVWSRKLICSCGNSFNRRVWHRTASGEVQYAYQCYNSINTGSVSTRKRKGLSVEGICDSPMIPQWRLYLMADYIFQMFWNDKSQVISIATEMIKNHIDDEESNNNEKEIMQLENKREKLLRKLDNLIEMRMSDELSKELFLNKKEIVEKDIQALTEKIESLVVDDAPEKDYQKKLEVLKYGLEEDFDFSNHRIPDTIIDAFVEQIEVHKDVYIWKLCFTDNDIACTVNGNKRKASVSLINTPTVDTRNTGSS